MDDPETPDAPQPSPAGWEMEPPGRERMRLHPDMDPRLAQLIEMARTDPEAAQLLRLLMAGGPGAQPQAHGSGWPLDAVPGPHAGAAPPPGSEQRASKPEEKAGEEAKHQETVRHEVINHEEAFSTVLREMWQIAARAVEGPGGRLASLALDDNAYLQAVRSRFQPEDFYSDEVDLGAEAAVSGLVGSIEEITLAVRHQTEQLGDDRAALRTFLTGILAATLERLERDGVGNAERRTDLVLFPLGRALSNRPPACSDGLRRFVAGLRGYLDNQPEGERTANYFITHAAVSDLLIHTRDPECLAPSVFYYHEILSHYCRLVEQAPEAFGPADRKRIKAVANNTSNLVEDVRRIRSVPENDKILEVRGALMRIAVTMGGETELSDAEVERAGSLLAVLLGADTVDPSWSLVLDDMMRSSSAWRRGFSYLQLGLMEAAAGVVRAAPQSRRPESAPLFYNAAVSLMSEPEKWDQEAFERGRAALCAIGMWWAFEGNLERPEVALLYFGGLSCAVNLFAAAEGIEWRDGDREVLGRIAGTLRALSSGLPSEAQLQFFRLEGFLRQLKVEPGEPALAELPADLDRLVSALRKDDTVRLAGDDPLGATVEVVRGVFAELARTPEDFQKSLVRPLVELLERIAEDTANPGRTLLELYRPYAGTTAEEIGRGPLVAAGLWSADAWQRVVTRAREPVESLAQLLRAEGRLDWLTQ